MMLLHTCVNWAQHSYLNASMDNSALRCMISVCLYASCLSVSFTYFIWAMFAWIKYDGWIIIIIIIITTIIIIMIDSDAGT